MFLTCGNCGAETTVANITRRGVDLREQLAKLRGQDRPPDAGYQRRMARLLERYQKEVSR